MAEQKKKTATVKNKNSKKTSENNRTAKSSKGNSSKAGKNLSKEHGMRKELVMLIMIGAAVLLFAFLISGSSKEAGFIGEAAVLILHGILGIGAWILPVALIVGAIYLATEKNDAIFKIRAVFSTVLFLDILAFIHSFGGVEQYSGMSVPAFISYAFRHGANNNGGLIGASVYFLFNKMVGNIGCYIIFILLAIILIMLISGGSFINGIRKMIGYADSMRDKYIDYYYDDEDEFYYDEIDAEADEAVQINAPKQKAKPIKKTFEPKIDEDAQKILAIDIKKSGKRDNKINLITDELPRESNIDLYEDNDDDIARLMDIFDRNKSNKKSSSKKEEVENEEAVENAEYGTTDFNLHENDLYADDILLADNAVNDESSVYNSPNVEADSFDEYNLSNNNTDSLEDEKKNTEDVPPWEDLYSVEDEPEIIEAEKTKLVDKLEVDKKKTAYKFPKLEFLGEAPNKFADKTKAEILQKSKKLEDTLAIFKVEAKVNNISIGPTVTRYELTPSTGTKVSAVTNLENDIKFSMAAESIIIEAPIPGKSAIGIEIPNDTRESVYFSEVLRSEQFQKFKSKIAFGLGKDITGSVKVADLAKMPHLLVAGTTGSGKSVCINTLVMSILYKASPDEVKMIMVDPKMVELSVYNGIPHLLLPVVTEPEKAAGALNWAVIEMERRYKLLAKSGTRNLEGYNQKVSKEERLSQIVIIIDELADLMMVVGKEIETSICRLAQKARAAGMHLVLATQRPSADVLTGLIRSNVPSRIAFKVSGSMDSRIILDSTGAEKLLGKGDMLFKTADMSKPMRIQGAFITDDEVERVVNYIGTDEPNYDESIINEIAKASISVTDGADGGEDDPMTDEVMEWIVTNPKCASAGKVQRHFRIGFNRASRIIEALEERGILGPVNGSQPREVLMDKYELRERKERYESYDNY